MKNLYSLLLFLPLFTLGQQTLFNCDGVDISNQSYSVEADDNVNHTLTWNIYEFGTNNSVSTAIMTNQNTENVIIDWSAVPPGTYTLEFMETNTVVPCSGTEELTVIIEDGSFSATAIVTNVCEGTTEEQAPTITLSETLSSVSYDWGSASPNGTDLAVLALSEMVPSYNGTPISANTPLQGSVIITNEDNQCTFTLTTDFYNVVPNPDPSAITF